MPREVRPTGPEASCVLPRGLGRYSLGNQQMLTGPPLRTMANIPQWSQIKAFFSYRLNISFWPGLVALNCFASFARSAEE
jgi:hypothetical protein